MSAAILGLLAETFIHPGTGQLTGAIDLPVAREKATDYPYVSGSSLKGALRDAARRAVADEAEVDLLFGKQDTAGALLVSDARLLLLPVRSLTGSYAWLTCPLLLERLQRDLGRAGLADQTNWRAPQPDAGRAVASRSGKLFLEERTFQADGDAEALKPVAKSIAALIAHEAAAARLPAQLVVLSDDDFAWFARFGLAVQARNVLHEETKESMNLWYEETLSPDSLFYAYLADRAGANGSGLDAALGSLFAERPYLQVGGNETVGHGWFAVQRVQGGGHA